MASANHFWRAACPRIGINPAVLELAGVSVHDMNVLSEEELLRASEPSAVEERAGRLRELCAQVNA